MTAHSRVRRCIVAALVLFAGVASSDLLAAPATTQTASTAPIAERKPGTSVRIILVGDSTVTDKAGWGLAFSKLLKDDVECINTSRGGRSTLSFIAEGSWQKALALKGDWYLIQFGHNDQKLDDPKRGTNLETYEKCLRQYVDETRAAGAKPILITPMTRRQFQKDGKIKSGLQDRADVMKKVAAEMQVPILDLHARTIVLFDGLGKEKCDAMAPKKENGDVDGTHLTPQSAALVAPLVEDELKRAVPDLASAFK
jgi:pectinesterase